MHKSSILPQNNLMGHPWVVPVVEFTIVDIVAMNFN